MTAVILFSDILLFGIISVVGWIFIRSLRNPLLPQWHTMFKKPGAMASGILLAFFVTIALLDSLRFESHFIIQTLLDLCLSTLNKVEGPSYSPPFTAISSVLQQPLLTGLIKGWQQGSLTTLLIIALTGMRGRVRGYSLYHQLVTLMTGRSIYAWRTFFISLWLVLSCLAVFYQWSEQYFIAGTDKLGNDVLYTALKSIRTALVVGLISTLLLLPCALFFGLISGFFGSRVDMMITYLYTLINAIPSILLLAAAVLLLQTSHIQSSDNHLLILCLILGLTSWAGICRLVRAETLKIREYPFVKAVQLLGLSNGKILLKHILPAVWPVALVTVTLDFSGLVLAEVVLSYLGIGVGEGIYSFGTLMNNARLELVRLPVVWWPLFCAFSLLSLLIVAANLMSDALQAFFDPLRRPE